MEPLAAGIKALIAIAVALGVLVGAGTGAASWRGRRGLTFWSVLALAIYSFASVAVLRDFFLVAPYWGIAPLIFSFLVVRLLSGVFRARVGLRPTWSRISAVTVAATAAALYLLALRQDLVAPVVVVLLIDVALAVLTVREVKNGASHGAQRGA